MWEQTPSQFHGGRNPVSQLAALGDPSSWGWRESPGAAGGIPPPPPAAPAQPHLSELLRWHSWCHNWCHSPECGRWQSQGGWDTAGAPGWIVPASLWPFLGKPTVFPTPRSSLEQRTKPWLCPGMGAALQGLGQDGEVTLGVAQGLLSTVPARENAGRMGFRQF